MTSIIARTVTAVLALTAATSVDAAALKPNRVDIEYVPPKSSAHDELLLLPRLSGCLTQGVEILPSWLGRG